MQTFDDYALDRAYAKRVGSLIHMRGRVAVVQTTIPVDPNALHVSAADVALVSRGSLADYDPFQPMSPRERSYTVADNARVHYAECGYFARLSAVQARLADHARDGRAR